MKYKTYKYTNKDIALAAMVSESKVRRDRAKGVFHPESLASTAAYVIGTRLWGRFGVCANLK